MRKARGAVGHQALALRGADRGAEIGLARQAGRALPAFRRVQRNDVIALLDAGDALADVDHDARAFMAEDRRKQSFRIGAGQCEFVGVADAGGLDLDQHFAFARPLELDGGYFQRLSSSDGDGGANIHGDSSFQIFGVSGLRYVKSRRSPRAISACRIAYDRATGAANEPATSKKLPRARRRRFSSCCGAPASSAPSMC